ncbi:MAG: 3-hydroxyacyl-CoA dehydrogenase family protein, partial [Actinomycetota bacterium]|nr:3-hydroxyacyl-CoA dehydrogenase family protein [Actinomycetota bacterium]
ARNVDKIGVVGAGLMGAQLGALLLQRLQVPLVVKDVDARALERARSTIEAALDKRVRSGRLRQAKAGFLKSVVTYSREDPPLAGCDVVVEAVREDLDLKQRVFATVERVVEPGCVLASNTSSLPVTAMASALAHPQRVVGFHVFNPVAVLPLVEVVRTDAVSDEALSTAFQLADALGKSAVACADSPGFVVNRLLTRLLLSCVEAANRGAGFAEVDDAVTVLGLPMGPFELLGLIGLPVVAEVVQVLHGAYPERFRLEPNVQMLADSGLPGVYDSARGRTPYDEVARRWRVDPQARKPTPEDIRRQALEALAREARIILDEAVVADARDIDTCMLLGAGWPFFMGGICKHLDQVGISRRLFGAPLVGATDQAFA